MDLLPGVVGGGEVLGPILDPFDWAAGEDRGVGNEKVLGKEVAADAEAPAGIGGAHVNAGWRSSQQAGQDLAVVVRDQCRTPDRELVPARVEVADQSSRFERYA